ncbi:MAG: hypothetical protein AB8H47_19730 [Bacteroidia bacterium]
MMMEDYQPIDYTELLANSLALNTHEDWLKFWWDRWVYETNYRLPITHRKKWLRFLKAMKAEKVTHKFSAYFYLKAITTCDCSATGMIRVGNQSLEAKSESGFIPANTIVRITGWDINLFTIRKVE